MIALSLPAASSASSAGAGEQAAMPAANASAAEV
jgi:hypothetical protein